MGDEGGKRRDAGVQPPAPGDAGPEGAEGSGDAELGAQRGKRETPGRRGGLVRGGGSRRAERAQARPLWGPPRVPRSAGCPG